MAPKKARASLLVVLLKLLGGVSACALTVGGGLVATHYPWDADASISKTEQEKNRAYYQATYKPDGKRAEPQEIAEEVAKARAIAEGWNLPQQVERFVAEHALADKKVIEVGSGAGYLQDLVKDYTALDVSPGAERFIRKKFVLGSATAMPIGDSEFDGMWTIWVLEHVPHPEAALEEMRRVMKSGGVMFVSPAWSCPPWAAEGYPVRPYSDFGWQGKATKAAIPARVLFGNLARIPVRMVRQAEWKAGGAPTRLHYQRLAANYEKYWMPDSDAVNSLDRYETAMWFQSRGDECLNCDFALETAAIPTDPLIIRVRK
jgi:SAM-dependent methyltransferase